MKHDWSARITAVYLYLTLHAFVGGDQLTLDSHHDPSSNHLQFHVADTPLNIIGMSDSSSSLMALSSNNPTALRAASSLHGHPALANCERMAVLALPPVTSAAELGCHGGHDLPHLFIGDGLVKCASPQHLLNLVDFGSYSSSRRMLIAEQTGFSKTCLGIVTEKVKRVVFVVTATIVSLWVSNSYGMVEQMTYLSS